MLSFKGNSRSILYGIICRFLSSKIIFESWIYFFIVNRYIKKSYRGIQDNVVNLGYSLPDAKKIAVNESRCSFIRDIYSFYYDESGKELSNYIDNLRVIDEGDMLMSAIIDDTSMLAVLHFGHYWETVAKIIKMSERKKKFVIPILSLKHEHTKKSILSLKPYCESLQLVDLSDRSTSVRTISRCIKNGYKLIIFPDLPPSIGGVYFGSPSYGRFFGRNASVASGAVYLSKLFGLTVVYVSNVPKESDFNEVVLLEVVKSEDISVDKNFDVIERNVRNNPSNWAYLDRVENYFHHQLSEVELRKKWMI
ncbi:hypothetical protein HJA72_004191 [Vibrio fluvialis]|nr:hypothetical protein [Vibrio fluvialis]